jgi:hypothetical protein
MESCTGVVVAVARSVSTVRKRNILFLFQFVDLQDVFFAVMRHS